MKTQGWHDLQFPVREAGEVVKVPPTQISRQVGDWQWRQDEQVRMLLKVLGLRDYTPAKDH